MIGSGMTFRRFTLSLEGHPRWPPNPQPIHPSRSYRVPHILPSFVSPNSFVFTLFTKLPGCRGGLPFSIFTFPFSRPFWPLVTKCRVCHTFAKSDANSFICHTSENMLSQALCLPHLRPPPPSFSRHTSLSTGQG